MDGGVADDVVDAFLEIRLDFVERQHHWSRAELDSDIDAIPCAFAEVKRRVDDGAYGCPDGGSFKGKDGIA